jgi:predicted kinase
MAPLIILTGLPATGKTTLARALAVSAGWPLLSKDALKEPLMTALPRLAAPRSRDLSDASFALLFALLPRVLEQAPGAVVEGNFRSGQHEAGFHEISAPRPVLQVLCRVAEPTRRERILARAAERDARHPREAELARPAECDRFLELRGGRIQLDGDEPLDASLHAIRSTARQHGFCV